MTSTTQTAIAYGRLPHFIPIVAVLSTAAATAWVVAGDTLNLTTLFRMLVALLGGQLLIGVVNELVDADLDAATKPDKPIPAGVVSQRGAMFLGAIGVLLMIIFGATFSTASFILLLLGTGIGVAYSFWFKQSRFAWFPYLIALPLLPNWVAVSFDVWTAELLLLFPLGAFGVVAVQLAQSLPDVAADRLAGLDTVSTRLGETRTIRLCWFDLLITIAVYLIFALVTDHRTQWVIAVATAALALVLINVVLFRTDRSRGVAAAFPLTVGVIGLLGVSWVALVT